MTREIKFRAWDKKRKEWYGTSDPDSTTFYGFHLFGECTAFCYPSIEDLEHLEITQFTGLHDSTKWEELTEDERTKWVLDGNMPSEWKGKPIYEGDIVVAYDNAALDPSWGLDRYHTGFIEYESNNFSLNCNGIYLDCWINAENIEVIGNVFENPELLELQP